LTAATLQPELPQLLLPTIRRVLLCAAPDAADATTHHVATSANIACSSRPRGSERSAAESGQGFSAWPISGKERYYLARYYLQIVQAKSLTVSQTWQAVYLLASQSLLFIKVSLGFWVGHRVIPARALCKFSSSQSWKGPLAGPWLAPLSRRSRPRR
jgi:hypothetical protein